MRVVATVDQCYHYRLLAGDVVEGKECVEIVMGIKIGSFLYLLHCKPSRRMFYMLPKLSAALFKAWLSQKAERANEAIDFMTFITEAWVVLKTAISHHS